MTCTICGAVASAARTYFGGVSIPVCDACAAELAAVETAKERILEQAEVNDD